MKKIKYGDPVIETITGKIINLKFPNPELIDIDDIAHGLSNICRFNGQCKRFYSVASHSIMVASSVPEHLRLAAILHDATEAYLGDVIKPLKHLLPDYEEIEYIWESAVISKFKIKLKAWEKKLIKTEDCRWFSTESLELMSLPVISDKYKPYNTNLPNWDTFGTSKVMFLNYFAEIIGI